MESEICIATAGNTLAPALAVLKSMGYVVGFLPTESNEDSELLQATKPGYRLIAEDVLLLLGLATLAQARGADWKPTDSEVNELLACLQVQ